MNINLSEYQQYNLLSYGFYEMKKSKFHCFIFRCENIESYECIKKFIKSKFSNAAHIVSSAYFSNKEIASEDREVGSSAKKILFALKMKPLKDVAVFIPRIFGGTLLGVGNVEKSFLSSFTNAVNNINN